MFNSLRWSLQLWHAALLSLVLVGFGTASYYGLRQARYQELDAQLERSVHLLASGMRPPRPQRGGPPWFQNNPDFGGGPDGRGGGPDGRGGFDGRGGGPDGRGGFDGQGGGPDGRFRRDGRGGRGGRGNDFQRPPFDDQPPPDGAVTRPFQPPPGEIEIPPDLPQRFGDGDAGTIYYFIWDYDRNTIKTTFPSSDVPEPGPPPAHYPPNNFPVEVPTFRWRGDLREAYVTGPVGTRILVGKSFAPDQAALLRSAWLLSATGAAVLLIGLCGGWLLSLRAVRPIEIITATAKDISATNLSRRINVKGTQTELGHLASVLNDTFARLESAFQQQVRFTADASHELRTPLAVIHTNAQLALSRARTAEEYRETLESCLRASTRMKGLVDSLLVLAKVDAGSLSFERTLFDLRDIIEDAVSLLAPLAEEKKIALESNLKSVELSADPTRIAQVVANLLTNAIRYNREGGRVQITLDTNGPEALLTIADTGIGIPTENQPHLFERFYRVDPARSRELGGSGLGLAICKSIVEAHGGAISFTSEPNSGTTFTVRLPRRLGQ